MTGATRERIKKLPVWAQQYIARLEGSLQTSEARLGRLLDPVDENTRMFHTDMAKSGTLPPMSRAVFLMDTPNGKTERVQVGFAFEGGQIDPTKLWVQTGMFASCILPDARNSFRVGFQK